MYPKNYFIENISYVKVSFTQGLNNESKGKEMFVEQYDFLSMMSDIVKDSKANKILSNLSRNDLFFFNIYSASVLSLIFSSYTTPPPWIIIFYNSRNPWDI